MGGLGGHSSLVATRPEFCGRGGGQRPPVQGSGCTSSRQTDLLCGENAGCRGFCYRSTGPQARFPPLLTTLPAVLLVAARRHLCSRQQGGERAHPRVGDRTCPGSWVHGTLSLLARLLLSKDGFHLLPCHTSSCEPHLGPAVTSQSKRGCKIGLVLVGSSPG